MHWNGGRDSVEPLLKYCELKQYRTDNEYQWARLCQVIGNFFGGTTSVGIQTVDHLDCDNFDNGVYIIDDNWRIVDRKFFDNRTEQQHYDFNEMLLGFDECMPEHDRITNFLKGEKIESFEDLKVGDKIVFISDGKEEIYTILGFGEDIKVNGYDVKGLPIINSFKDYRIKDEEPVTIENVNLDNCNNYLTRSIEEYRKIIE